jgi:ATPase subunit of ABC transporter with duplicated ATPase domains
MLHLTDISKSFGSQVILDKASLHVKPGMRVGLVGANGAGKTTLLRIIAGEMSLDGGEVSARKDLRIGFLPQEIEEIADHPVMDEVLASYADILTAEHRISELGRRLETAYSVDRPSGADDVDPEELLRELGALDRLEARTGTNSRHGRSPFSGAWASTTTISNVLSLSFRAGGACGWHWPGSSWSSPIYSSWTSPPITSTWRASCGWRSSCSIGRALS